MARNPQLCLYVKTPPEDLRVKSVEVKPSTKMNVSNKNVGKFQLYLLNDGTKTKFSDFTNETPIATLEAQSTESMRWNATSSDRNQYIAFTCVDGNMEIDRITIVWDEMPSEPVSPDGPTEVQAPILEVNTSDLIGFDNPNYSFSLSGNSQLQYAASFRYGESGEVKQTDFKNGYLELQFYNEHGVWNPLANENEIALLGNGIYQFWVTASYPGLESKSTEPVSILTPPRFLIDDGVSGEATDENAYLYFSEKTNVSDAQIYYCDSDVTRAEEDDEFAYKPIKVGERVKLKGYSTRRLSFYSQTADYNESKNTGLKSPVITSSLGDDIVTSAPMIEDENASPEWYSIQGQKLSAAPTAPGLYICRQGAKATKVMVK